MKTLEQIKKDKNWLACQKGYPIDPEGFSFKKLMDRLNSEYGELIDETYILTDNINPFERESVIMPESRFIFNDEILNELADMSNFIDYIATKIITNYPTKYKDDDNEG